MENALISPSDSVLKLENFRRVDAAPSQRVSYSFVQILNLVAKGLGPKKLHSAKAGDGEAVFFAEFSQVPVLDEPSQNWAH